MVKKMFQLFFVFVSVIIILAIIFLLSVNLLLTKERRDLANRAGTYLNRELTMEHLFFNPLKGVKAYDLKVSNSPNFSKGKFFSFKNALIVVDFNKLLRKKEIDGKVYVDSLYFDVFEKESILSNLTKKVQACQSKSKDFQLYSSFIPFSVSSLTFNFKNSQGIYAYRGNSVTIVFSGEAGIKPQKEDQRIELIDFVLKDSTNTLNISGVMKDFYDIDKFSYDFNIKGDKVFLSKLIKFLYTYPKHPEFSIQIGKGAYVDLNIAGNLKNIKAVPNKDKTSLKN